MRATETLVVEDLEQQACAQHGSAPTAALSTATRVVQEQHRDDAMDVVARADEEADRAQEGGRRPVYLNTKITLKEVGTATQTFTVSGFVNALWRCPDLESESDCDSYYEDDHEKENTVKEQVNAGKIHDDKDGRKYIDGFTLNPELPNVLPFNPQRPWDAARVVSSEIKDCDFYYYPVRANEGRGCAGLVKMAIDFEVTLTQTLDMRNFPFDRQVLHVSFYVRTRKNDWYVMQTPPGWVDTGHDNKYVCRVFASPQIVHYQLASPLLSCSQQKAGDGKDQKGIGYIVGIRVERKFMFELRKMVLPLFMIVNMATTSFGLEPDETGARIAAPTGMLLATIGFQYVILENVPKTPTITKMDKYVNICIVLIVLVVVETLVLKMILERGVTALSSQRNIATVDKKSKQWQLAESIDTCCALALVVLWIIPHILLFTVHSFHDKLLQSWSSAGKFAELQAPQQYDISMDGRSGHGGGYEWTGLDMSVRSKAKEC
eukprot:COSAG02_NODE_4038_length_5874_cov_2.627661_4_plen_491_part_00